MAIKKLRNAIFYLICCLLIQSCMFSGSLIALPERPAEYINNECLSPCLQIELSFFKEGFSFFSKGDSFYGLSSADKKGYSKKAGHQQSELTIAIQQKSALLSKVKEEKNHPGTVILPKIIVMSDFHGEIKLFLTYVADAISQHINQTVSLDHTIFPDFSIEEQLKRQGVDIKSLKNIRFNLLGDFSDRGRYGMKCARAGQELKELGIADVVTGNHDLLEFLASIGYHLPIYKGFDFHGSIISEKLVQQHWNDEQISRDRKGWWSVKLAEYVKARQALQQEEFLVNGKVDIKEVRRQLKQLYLRIKDQLDEAEVALWEDLIGFYFGETDVYTGFNAVGMMSVEWWAQRAKRVDVFLKAARRRVESENERKESQHQIIIWEDLKEYTDAAYELVKKQTDEAIRDGKWWHQVFNDINNKAYESAQWYAMDWIFHKGWGTSVISELNELEKDKSKIWDSTNFMKNEYIKSFAAFSRENFTLYVQDEYGNYYTHGWFPVNVLDGTIGVKYKNILYKGEDLWEGLQIIQNDIRSKPMEELSEAFALVMSWYADKTVRIKPEHIVRYIKQWGIEKIQKGIGANIWFTCHNPLNKLQLYGIGFKIQEGECTHISVDKGMSWKKFKDVGGYVQVGAQGVKLRGFGGVDFKEIIDHPHTMTLAFEDETQRWYEKEMWENESLSRNDFLDMVINKLGKELQRFKGIEMFLPEAQKLTLIKIPFFLIEQAI